MWELLWYNCSPVYGLPSWQLYCETDDSLLQEDYATCLASQDGCCQSPCPCCGPRLTCASSGDTQPSKAGLAQSLMEVNAPFSGSSCTQGFVCTLRTSLVVMGFDFKSYCIPATVFLWLFLCPWTWGNFFFDGFQHSSAASCDFGVLAGKCPSILPCPSILSSSLF